MWLRISELEINERRRVAFPIQDDSDQQHTLKRRARPRTDSKGNEQVSGLELPKFNNGQRQSENGEIQEVTVDPRGSRKVGERAAHRNDFVQGARAEQKPAVEHKADRGEPR